MNTYTDKTQENKIRSVANAITQKKNGAEATFQFVDNRPEAIAQRKLQAMANNIPQVKPLRTFKDIRGNSFTAITSQLVQKQSVPMRRANNSKDTIQRAGEEIEMTQIRARTATCTTIGVQHEDGKSFASVRSEASSLQQTDSVIYEIAWDAPVAPVGHEGMAVTEGVASDFIVDRSQTGESIGENRGHYHRDDSTGRYSFLFNDGIEWPMDLNGGSWRFRLRVVNGAGTEVASSEVATVNWNHD